MTLATTLILAAHTALSPVSCAVLVAEGDRYAARVVPSWGAVNGEEAMDAIIAADDAGDPDARAAFDVWAVADRGGCWGE